MIVSNTATSSKGDPVGVCPAALIHPYDVFTAAGCQVTIASPQGGAVEFDALSTSDHLSGFSSLDTLSAQYVTQSAFTDQLANTPAIAELNTDDYDAIFVCGGQGTFYTFPKDKALANLFVNFYQANKPSATLCGGACLLLSTTLDNGEPLIQGKMITGFSKKEGTWIAQNVAPLSVPFVLEDEAKNKGANFFTSSAFSPFAIQDGNLITGQQKNSGLQTAGLVLTALNLEFDTGEYAEHRLSAHA